MSRLKIPRPPKWVLVRVLVSGGLYVLAYSYWQEVRRRHPAYDDAELIASSNDRDELMRFQKLTEEN